MHMRKDGERYEKGSLRYGFGSPVLSGVSCDVTRFNSASERVFWNDLRVMLW